MGEIADAMIDDMIFGRRPSGFRCGTAPVHFIEISFLKVLRDAENVVVVELPTGEEIALPKKICRNFDCATGTVEVVEEVYKKLLPDINDFDDLTE